MFKIGNIVRSKRLGYHGLVVKCFASWQDLKQQEMFLTLDPDNESDEMDAAERIINGDPKDVWLKSQEIPYTEEQLEERWYSVRCFDGGSAWNCDSALELVDPALN